MKTPLQTIEDSRREFFEYMSEGYAGGVSGLRCDRCDSKYSGTSGLVQLCPSCRVYKKLEALLDSLIEERKRMQVYDTKDNWCAGYMKAIDQVIQSLEELKAKVKENE
jgi:hypothetical protein